MTDSKLPQTNSERGENDRLPPAEHARAAARVETLARVLDDWVRIPGIGYRVGVDSVIGLIPVVGDVTSAALGGYMVFEGWRLGAPKNTLGKMAGNVGLDLVAGLIPGVGDLVDFAFKSNRRNLRLLRQHVDSLAPPPEPEPTPSKRRWITIIAATCAAVVLIGLVAL